MEQDIRTLRKFSAILRETIIPYLREDGFKGSVPTLRWVGHPVIQVIHFQGIPLGGACFINIGIHLNFLPFPQNIPPTKLDTYQCIFRERVSSPISFIAAWPYTWESANAMVSRYLSTIRPFFHHFRQFPDAFLLLSPDDILHGELSALPGTGKALKRSYAAQIYITLYEYIGDYDMAQKFIEVKELLEHMRSES